MLFAMNILLLGGSKQKNRRSDFFIGNCLYRTIFDSPVIFFQASCQEQAEANERHVQDSFSHDEADVLEEIRGWKEWRDEQGQCCCSQLLVFFCRHPHCCWIVYSHLPTRTASPA
jgi:hypothetical protein